MEPKCATRALKNARYIQSVAPHILPAEEPAEGFESIIPMSLLSRLGRAKEAELGQRTDLLEFQQTHNIPLPADIVNGPLFQGSLVFVRIIFGTNSGPVAVNAADMTTMVAYATAAADPIVSYASQYGLCGLAVDPTVISFSVQLQNNSYTNQDLESWIDTIVAQQGLATSSWCVVIPEPEGKGVANKSVGLGTQGFHSTTPKGTPYCWAKVYGSDYTVDDSKFLYADQLSHEIAEMLVDPLANNSNPEVCDACAGNCGTSYAAYFAGNPPGYLDTLVYFTQPTFQYDFFIAAIVSPSHVTECPPTSRDACAYSRKVTPPTKVHYPKLVYQSTLDRITVFVVGDNGHLYDKYWSGTEWVWEDQGTPAGTSVTIAIGAVYQPPLDRVTIFVIGADGHLYDKYWSGRQWVWEDQGIPPAVPAVSAAADSVPPSALYQPTLDRITVFVMGDNGHLFDKYWNGRQWVWEDQGLPAGATSLWSPSAVYQTKSDRISLFVVGGILLYDKYWNGTAWVWENQDSPPATGVTISINAIYQPTLDRITAFVIGDNGHLFDKYWNGNQWVWEDQGLPAGASAVSSPSAVYQTKLDRIMVFVVGDNGHLYDKYWSGAEWIWENQGNPPGTTVPSWYSAVSTIYQPTLDRIMVFAVGGNGHLYDKYWNGTAWVWEDQGMPPSV